MKRRVFLAACAAGTLAAGCARTREMEAFAYDNTRSRPIMPPLIGVTGDLQETAKSHLRRHMLRTTYTGALHAAGAAAVILPLATEETCGDVLRKLDGLILSGGGDIPKTAFEGRDLPNDNTGIVATRFRSECLWLKTALALDMPVLGICLGAEIIHLCAGGTLVYDIPTEMAHAINHRENHAVRIEPHTRLAECGLPGSCQVVSWHHHAIRDAGNGYRPAAYSSDNLIEAIEDPARRFAIGVQWHPERSPNQPDPLLTAFVAECGGASQ